MTYTLASEAPERFLQAFNNLAVSKSGEHDENEFESYFQELGELPIDSVEQAARELKRTPGPFMPDCGTWFRLADKIAAEALEKDNEVEVLQLSSGQHIERDAIERTKVARAEFVEKLEALTGRTLPDDHPMKSGDIRLPTFACHLCKDSGFVSAEDRRVERCVCHATNPVLQKYRVKSRVKDARNKVG
jgi:hypothetical protein